MSSMKVMNPRVRWFAEEMRKKLRENTRKTESRDLSFRKLKGMLNVEMSELTWAIQARNIMSADDVIEECADIANYAMMIADKMHEQTYVRVDPKRRRKT